MHAAKVIFSCIVCVVIGAVVSFVCTAVIGLVLMIGFAITQTDWDSHRQTLDLIAYVCLAAGPIIGVSIPIIGELRRQQKEHEEEQNRSNQALASQRALALQLSTLMLDSSATANGLPGLISIAEATLDRAEEEFRDGAFAPFWDAVEEAANTLARFNATVQGLVNNATNYRSKSSTLPAPLPPFKLGVQTLPNASPTAERMRKIVRKAQKDFKFATIFEQRKTNQLLVAGFSSLGQAINELGDRLDSSLEALGCSVGIAVADASVVASNQLESLRQQIASDSGERRKHEEDVRGMLDNIQRRRKPLLP